MIDMANDVVVHDTMPNIPAPKTGSRTQFQVVVLAEDTWLKQYLIETDVYICPSEVMQRHSASRRRK